MKNTSPTRVQVIRKESKIMTAAQENALKVFEQVRGKATVTKLARNIEQYTYEEDGWKYTFFTAEGKLKRVEAFNHREFIEVQF